MIVLSDTGARLMLVSYFTVNDLSLRLFTNNRIPSDTDLLTDYVEAVGGRYARKTLLGGRWIINEAHDQPDVYYASQTFIFNGPLDLDEVVYGYFVVDSDKRER